MSQEQEPRAELSAFLRPLVGPGAFDLAHVAGDASGRRYYRARRPDGGSLVVMELGRVAPAVTLPYPGPVIPVGASFLDVQGYLDAGAYPVPRVLGADVEAGFIALEDLGDRTLESCVSGRSPPERRGHYLRAVDLIVELQALGRRRPQGCVAFDRRFDAGFLRWELAHFQEWFLEKGRGVSLSAEERTGLDAGFGWVARTIAETPPCLVHRDFQSRNLMMTAGPSGDGEPRMVVIDFQDALLGSPAYDLVALLRDSYVELQADEVESLRAAYVARIPGLAGDAFTRLFHLQTIQRKLKDAGRFIFLDRVRGNASFLKWIPSSLRYVREALARVPELAAARAVLERHVPELRS